MVRGGWGFLTALPARIPGVGHLPGSGSRLRGKPADPPRPGDTDHRVWDSHRVPAPRGRGHGRGSRLGIRRPGPGVAEVERARSPARSCGQRLPRAGKAALPTLPGRPGR